MGAPGQYIEILILLYIPVIVNPKEGGFEGVTQITYRIPSLPQREK